MQPLHVARIPRAASFWLPFLRKSLCLGYLCRCHYRRDQIAVVSASGTSAQFTQGGTMSEVHSESDISRIAGGFNEYTA